MKCTLKALQRWGLILPKQIPVLSCDPVTTPQGMQMSVFWYRARGGMLKWKGDKGGKLRGRSGAQVAQWCEDQWQQLLKLCKEDKIIPSHSIDGLTRIKAE